MSEGQRALIRRTATLCVELEHMESKFAARGCADIEELECFQRATNSLRRLVESLGVHRGKIPRDQTKEWDAKRAEYVDDAANG